MTASPMSGWWSCTTLATSPMRSGSPFGVPRSTTSQVVRRDDRQHVADRRAAGSGCRRSHRCRCSAPSENFSRPASSASAVASMTSSSGDVVLPAACPARPGPGMLLQALAPDRRRWRRPGTRSRRGADRPVGRSSTCRSSETASTRCPIFMTRLVADSGCSMTGGAAQVGSVGVTVASRSWTSWRACSRSVPGLKISSIDGQLRHRLRAHDRRGPAMPLSACSSGTVTS